MISRAVKTPDDTVADDQIRDRHAGQCQGMIGSGGE
jgi:hypothetical protein